MHLTTRNFFGTAAVIGLAFAAGSFSTSIVRSSEASPQDPAQDPEKTAAFLDESKPGKHHRYLDALIGEWEGYVKIWMAPDTEPMESKGAVHREWVLDGHFVHERVEASMQGVTFSAESYIGYNDFDGQYQSIWMENMSNAIIMEHGVYSEEEKMFKFFGNHRMPTGKMQMGYSEIDVSDPNSHTLTGYTVDAEGNSYKNFEGVFEKKN